MGRVGKMISFTSEAVKIIEGLERGELSRICNEAILAEEPDNLTLEEVKSKISFIKEDQQKSKKELNFLKNRAKTIENEEEKQQIVYTKQQEKTTKEQLELAKSKKQKAILLHKSKALELFKMSEEDAEKFSKQYINENVRGSFVKYFENLNFVRKKK